MNIRFFLVAPPALPEDQMLACAKAACEAADCATIVVKDTVSETTVAGLQALNLAVILNDCEARRVHHLKADGLLLSQIDDFKDARATLKNESLGLVAGISRHAAMEAAELGADFVCFTPSKQFAGEPIIGWWQDVTDIPAVAFDQTIDADLKSQRPDFVRPSDEMWQSPEAAHNIVKDLGLKWSA